MARLEISATSVIYTCWGSGPWRVTGGGGEDRKLYWCLICNLDSHLGLLGQVLFQCYFPEINGVMPAGNLTCYFWTRGSYLPTEQNILLTVEATLEGYWVYGKFRLDKISWWSSHDWLLFKLNYSADQLLSFPVSCCKRHVSERETFQVGSFTNQKTLPVVEFSFWEQNKGCQKPAASSIAPHITALWIAVLLWYLLVFLLRIKHLFCSLNRSSIKIVLSAWNEPAKAKLDTNTGQQKTGRIRCQWDTFCKCSEVS